MDCLVTKLKGAVNDSSLPELGCLYFTLQNANEDLVKIEAIGEGVEFFTPDKKAIFYSSSSKEGSGADKYNVAASNTIFYADASKKVRIGVRNKYALEKLDVYVSNNKTLTMEVDFNDLAYCKKLNHLALTWINLSGDISAFQNLTALTYINLYSTQVSGDISAFQNLTALTYINLGATQVSGDISALQDLTALTSISLGATQVSGDISAFQNLTALTSISLGATQVSGDISALQDLTALTSISLSATQVSGDISALDKLTQLTSFNVYTGGNFTGDFFGELASKDWTLFQCNGNFSYTTKNFSGRTYKSVGSNRCVCDNLDAFLNDFQNVNSTTGGELFMMGSRTSASDAAVSTLQGKGFTVSITEA